jgi:hypothetical protein
MMSRRVKSEAEREAQFGALPDIDLFERDQDQDQHRRLSPPTQTRVQRPRASPGQRAAELSTTKTPRLRAAERVPASAEPLVLPSGRQVLAQAFPNAALATALFVAAQYQSLLSPAGMPFWIILVFAPNLMTLILTDGRTNPLWRRAAMVNFITVGALLPILVIDRYLLRTPYLNDAHGAVLPTVIAVGVAIVALLALGCATAILSREDPEYAGVLILPACLLVPVCIGDTRVSSLEGTLQVASLVFAAAAVATVVASLLPGKLPALVAPAILAGEFILLSVLRQLPSVPSGAARIISAMFLLLMLAAGFLTIIVPMLSIWCARVRREVRRIDALTQSS